MENRILVTAYLTTAGFSVDTAVNGREAVEKFKRARYTAVLMDLQMPVMDGCTATRKFDDGKKQTPPQRRR